MRFPFNFFSDNNFLNFSRMASTSVIVPFYPTNEVQEKVKEEEEEEEYEYDEEEEDSEGEDENLPAHMRIKKKHLKIASRLLRSEKARRFLQWQCQRKGVANKDNTDMVFESDELRAIYDNVLYLGEDRSVPGFIYPPDYRQTLEEAMLAEYSDTTTQLFWPRGDNYHDIYFAWNDHNPFNDEFQKRAPYHDKDWQLSEGPALTEADKEILSKFVGDLRGLLRDCTTHMFVVAHHTSWMRGERISYDDDGKGFLRCEQERFRIYECLDKCDPILYPKSVKK